MSPKSRRVLAMSNTTVTKSESFDTATVQLSPSDAHTAAAKVLEAAVAAAAVATGTSEPKSPLLLIDKKELEAVREDGRMQAYGWSLPYKNREPTSAAAAKEPILNISVPVPVYCRPLFQKV